MTDHIDLSDADEYGPIVNGVCVPRREVDPHFKEIAHNELIADRAREYVAARKANDAASVDSWSIALTNLDFAWHRLLEEVERWSDG